MKKIVYLLLTFLFTTLSVQAVGISSVSFGDVEQGRTYVQNVTLVNSINDFDNHFVVEIEGNAKDWIKISPSEFDLKKGENKVITLTFIAPDNAPLGDTKSIIIAEGKKNVPSSSNEEGASVGYAVATKGTIYVNIIKQGALASVEILDVEVASNVPAGSAAKFTINAKNNGNVVTSAKFKVDIKKDGKLISSNSGENVDFGLNEEKSVKLYWDTEGAEEGNYEAYIEASTIAKGSEKTSISKYKPVSVKVGGADYGIILAAVVGVVVLIGIVYVLKRKK